MENKDSVKIEVRRWRPDRTGLFSIKWKCKNCGHDKVLVTDEYCGHCGSYFADSEEIDE